MEYNILYENPEEDIIKRLLKIREIEDDAETFLHPTFSNYWIDPYKLKDFEKTVEKITKCINEGKRIVIFGDYDADGITGSYTLFAFLTKFLGHKNVTIRLPNRITDGYGIRKKHLDEAKSLGADIVITVDNGITAIEEADYAKQIGLEMIVTDHHKSLDTLPDAFAVVNPQVSEEYDFKDLAGVGVIFKLIIALTNKFIKKTEIKKQIINHFLPIVSIGTVADCVPLVNENRLFVKKGLEIINKKKDIPPSLNNFLKFLNLNGKIDTFHIGFIIAPRLNASGRLIDPYESLYCLLYGKESQQRSYLEKLEEVNSNRKQIQEDTFKEAEKMLDLQENILTAHSENFHEGIIGIVSGRITEKHNKPSAVFNIDKENEKATASLRGPEYFSIIDMLDSAGNYLERYGGHKQAGGLTVKLENLEKVIQIFQDYCKENIKEEDMKKTLNIDTKIHSKELYKENLLRIEELGPFGEGNPRPKFLIEDITINSVEKVGKNGNSHMKIHGEKNGIEFPILFRGKGEEIDNVQKNISKNLIGKVKKNSYNGSFMIEGESFV